MKILHLSTSDFNGGAARAAFRLHKGLIQNNIESMMFVRDSQNTSGIVNRYRYPAGIKRINYRLRNFMIENDFKKFKSTRPEGLEVFSDDRTALKTGFFEQLPDTDIINLHWISGFLDLPSFFDSVDKPVVWTLHDMFPFTGGCHYNNGCNNFINYCHNCPQLGSLQEKDLAYDIWTRKLRAISQFSNKIVISADSYWLAGEAKKSNLFKDLEISTIHYGIETDEFIPRDRIACRRAFNIPENSKVIVFGAPGIDNPRKGFKQLDDALMQVQKKHSDLFLISFGSGMAIAGSEIPGLHLGYVENNHLLSIIYNSGDVFVIPSLQEAFGQTALESMSCGIPVAGFKTGGIPDMIQEGVTGFMAEPGNTKELAEAINSVLSLQKGESEKFSESCRQKVLNEFTLSVQAGNYISLYKNCLCSNKSI